MTKIAFHAFISGRVQGVFFRAHTQKQAQSLGLTGWVKNTMDDRVEVYACGDEQQIEEFKKWLWQGSTIAKVLDIELNEAPIEEHSNFEIRY